MNAGSGFGSGWYLDKVVIRSGAGKQWYFSCGRWLDKGEDDGLIERDLPASQVEGESLSPLINYRITVTTGDQRGAGIANYIILSIYLLSINQSINLLINE